MAKILLALFISTVSVTSSLSQHKKFGQVVFEESERTKETSDEIRKIKSLDNDLFDANMFISKEREEINYRLFKPDSETTTKTYPLILVYHGSAGIGTDNTSQLRLFQKLFVNPEIQKEYPAYVLAPQFSTRSSDYSMDETRNVLRSTPRACLNTVFDLVDSLKRSLNIDSNRVYVVGYSMGGSTVMNSLSERPDLFAAGISISGVPQFENPEEMSNIPIWLIHGTSDDVNPIDSDQKFYNEYSSNIRFWKHRNKNHNNIVTKHILGDAMPKWLFNHIKEEE